MKYHFEQLKPIVSYEYMYAPKSILDQILKALVVLLDMNADTEKYQQNIFISAPDDQVACFIKDKNQSYWISTDQVTSIYYEWEEVFQKGFSSIEKWACYYKEATGSNVVIVFINIYVNIWVYCFSEPALTSMDANFIQKYIGEVLDKDAAAKILEKLYY